MSQSNLLPPLQSDFQKHMLRLHSTMLYVSNLVANPFRKLFDPNTKFFVAEKPTLTIIK